MTVGIDDVREAAARIAGVAHRTPVATNRTFDRAHGVSAFFKCENFQRAGSFKFRGAFNALSRIAPEARARGVLTFSSGNHAQALALAGLEMGVKVTVVMPVDAPEVKRRATEGYGAEVVLYDRDETTRERLGASLADERGLTVVPPYDHPHIIAGQGTAGLELLEDAGPLDALVVCCGGGGLLGGCTLAARALSPTCRIVGVEPEAGDDGVRSFQSGSLQSVADPMTIADGARTPSLGNLNWEIVRTQVDDMVSVSDGELLRATKFLWERAKLVVEPTGALATAAVMTEKAKVSGRVGILISGGNVDVVGLGRMFDQMVG